MRKITHASLKKLSNYEGEPVLTIYVPTHRFPTPPNIQEDQTRFKNLVRAGCEQWRSTDTKNDVTAIQDELEALMDDLSFWQESLETLAIFAGPDGIELYHLPVECEERVFVGKRFDVTPLLLIDSMSQRAYVLALAMQDSKLYMSDMYGLTPVEVDFPKDVEDALNIDEMFSNSNTIRSGRTSGPNSIAAAPHGQGDSNDAGTEERLMYLRIIDERIRNLKEFDPTLPVVVAATDTEYGDFHSLSQLNIADVHIPGNYTGVPLNELHALVSSLLYKRTAQAQQRELDRFGEMKGFAKSSTDVADMTAAARDGRIDTLLLAMVDMTTDSVSDNEERKPLIRYLDRFDRTLFDLVCHTIANGGKVMAVARGMLPNLSSAAGIYRY